MRNWFRKSARQIRVAALVGAFALLVASAHHGQTLDTEFPLPADTACGQTLSSLAGSTDGSFLAVWSLFCTADGRVDSLARVFRANGAPASGDIRLNQFTEGLQHSPSVAALANGGYVTTWTSRPFALTDPPQDGSGSGIFARLLNRMGVPRGDEFQVNSAAGGNQQHPIAASHRGGFSILWAAGPDNTPLATPPGLYLQRFDSTGHPRGDETVAMGLPNLLTDRGSFDLAHAEEGGFAVAFSASSAHGYDVGAPTLFAPIPIPSSRVAAGDEELPRQPVHVPSDLTLQERFTAQVSWEDPRHHRFGEGKAVPISQSTGAFWFFGPDNLELLVKIVDGRSINGHFWLFYASLTDVRFSLTVTDNLTGKSQRYENPGRAFASHADTEAF